MLSNGMRNISTSVYLSALAVADKMALLYVLVRYWYSETLEVMFHRNNDILCKLDHIWKRIPVVLAAWLIISVCVERFIVTWFPLRASSVCRPKTAKIVVAVITILSTLYGLAAALQFGINTGPCDLSEFLIYFSKKDTKWVLTILYSFLPITILTVLSISIAFKLQRMTLKQTAMTSSNTSKQQENANKATSLVLTVSIAYIVLTLPSTVLLPLYRDINTKGGYRPETKLVLLISHTTILLNHAINFALFVLTSMKFRQKLVAMFCKRCQSTEEVKKRSTSIVTSQTSV